MRGSRGTIALLAASQGLLGTNNVVNLSVTGLAGYALATNKAWATLPQTAYIVGTALATVPASFWMRLVGRRWGFVTGSAIGVCGSALSALAMIEQSFWLLAAGVLLTGGYNAFGQYYRFAAVEAVALPWKARAIGFVLTGSIIGAVFGPEMSKHTKDALDVPFLGVYLFLGCCALTALLLQIARPLVEAPASPGASGPARPLGVIIVQPRFILAVLGAVVGYATMSFLMTSTPLAMMQHHHSYDATASVIEWHSLGMFAPSFVTGALIRRYGIFTIMECGVLLMLGTVAIAESGTGVAYFWAALLLTGIGWNFLYVGGTTLLTICHRASERAQVQGLNDMLVFASTGTASLMSGVLLNGIGWHSMVLATMPLLLLTIAALLWAGKTIATPELALAARDGDHMRR